MENLAELYLYHDREGLRWLIRSEDWVKHEEDGKTWIGSRHIAMAGNAPLPRGQYRAVLVNLGGERTESHFSFDGPVEPPHPFPSLSIHNGRYRIVSRYPLNHLICYDSQGTLISSFEPLENEGLVQDLGLSDNAVSAALWAEDPEYHISVLTEAAAILEHTDGM